MPDLSSFELFFPAEKISCAYKSIIELVEASDKSSISPKNTETLLIPIDDVIENWIDTLSYSRDEITTKVDNVVYACIGYFHIYKTIAGQDASIRITSWTSRTNFLIENCPSLHQQMLHVLEECDGLFGLIRTGEAEMAVMGKSDIFLVTDPDNYDTGLVDYIIETAKDQFDWLEL